MAWSTSRASFIPTTTELFTWWAPWRNMRERNIGWRLDYVLPSAALAERALRCEVDREYGTSDHGPVTAVFDVPPPEVTEEEPEPETTAKKGNDQLALF